MMFKRIVSDKKSKCKTIIESDKKSKCKQLLNLHTALALKKQLFCMRLSDLFILWYLKQSTHMMTPSIFMPNKLVQSLDNLTCSPSILVTLSYSLKLRIKFPLVFSSLTDPSIIISFMIVPSSISTWGKPELTVGIFSVNSVSDWFISGYTGTDSVSWCESVRHWISGHLTARYFSNTDEWNGTTNSLSSLMVRAKFMNSSSCDTLIRR